MFYFVAISANEHFEQWLYDIGDVYRCALECMSRYENLEDMYYIDDRHVVSVPLSWAILSKMVRQQMWSLPRSLADKGQTVAGIHCRRGSYRYFRHPRTMRSRRLMRGLHKIDRYPVRGKQSHLPSAWDDIGRSDAGIRSWKVYRRTQYKTT